jgi:hypothetical protein
VVVEGESTQPLNLYISQASGTKLDALYREAWHAGLKTIYYLRSRNATHVEKSTMKRTDGKLNAVSLDAVADMPLPLPMAMVTGALPNVVAIAHHECEERLIQPVGLGAGHLIPPGDLGRVQRLVRQPHQIDRNLAIQRHPACDSDADRLYTIRTGRVCQSEVFDGEPNLLSDLLSTELRGVGQDYCELLAANSRREPFGPLHDLGDHSGNRTQACVSAEVTDVIVILLEKIGIEYEKSQSFAASGSICPRVLQPKIEGASIGQAGQLVHVGEIAKSCLAHGERVLEFLLFLK